MLGKLQPASSHHLIRAYDTRFADLSYWRLGVLCALVFLSVFGLPTVIEITSGRLGVFEKRVADQLVQNTPEQLTVADKQVTSAAPPARATKPTRRTGRAARHQPEYSQAIAIKPWVAPQRAMPTVSAAELPEPPATDALHTQPFLKAGWLGETPKLPPPISPKRGRGISALANMPRKAVARLILKFKRNKTW